MNAMVIDPEDNVAVAVEPIPKGAAVELRSGATGVIAQEDITIYHKVAIRPIAKGEPVVKYGEHIGLASVDIAPGQHVHTHNVADHREAL